MADDDLLLADYYKMWIETYKKGAVRQVTYDNYELNWRWLKKLAPDLKLKDLTRLEYQNIINKFAETHEKVTVADFHNRVKPAILDAVDDDLLRKNPTRKTIIKGIPPIPKKRKYMDSFELKLFINELDLPKHKLNIDWLLLLISKTGVRLSEALGVTKEDFDFTNQVLIINKTWAYKEGGGFVPTKNKSSVRKIRIDWKLMNQFMGLIEDIPEGVPIFCYKKPMYNSTINNRIKRLCKKLNIAPISVHGLRHTHASLLLYNGVSVASVARRLGHADINTTQSVYIHIIQEMDNYDTDKIMRQLSQF
ncbi:site-specific integrase [Ligilactobacillus equi]|uniref:Phage family integrase n=1 Tax=Ligilactobacillus equi DSM 15833 = JCM 10991 TaxID=1423740 RepID=A0A0R1TF45_9LACO|nr:site-specific integrase [Ligilactobacillus equi]KRL79750.1 phage family integrase [Ligilactobacillus equi DSM 15833 = JCM 10991]